MTDKRIFVFGIRRSGIHVVSNWISDQFEGTVTANNVNLNAMAQGGQIPPALQRARTQVLIVEENPPNVIQEVHDLNGMEKWMGECEDVRYVMLVRDPYNLFASRIRHYDLLSAKKRWIDRRTATFCWKVYAETFLNPPEHLTVVNYNQFVAKKTYRRELAKALGGKFSDKTISKVDVNGLGSSFDGMKFDGNAQEMPVSERWKAFEDVEAFWNLFDDEIKGLCKKVFGFEDVRPPKKA